MGAGHVTRCLSLADVLSDQSLVCKFVCREHSGHLISLIRDRGYEVASLPISAAAPTGQIGVMKGSQTQHSSWLGVDFFTDAEQTKDVLVADRVDWLIVDHYAIDAQWERMMRPLCKKLMVIDDLADRAHDCDLLLDQNLGRKECDYANLVPDGCNLVVGPEYALLRPEFAALREYSLKRRRPPQLRKLLVSMGGMDADNATVQILKGLNECSFPADCGITVVMGKNAPWLTAVEQQAKRMSSPTKVLVNIDNMAQLMAESDLAIGGAGTTSWERGCLGLPTLVVVLARNQGASAKELVRIGAAHKLPIDSGLSHALQSSITEFTGNAEKLATMLEQSSKMTNGDGVKRLLAAMGNVRGEDVAS